MEAIEAVKRLMGAIMLALSEQRWADVAKGFADIREIWNEVSGDDDLSDEEKAAKRKVLAEKKAAMLALCEKHAKHPLAVAYLDLISKDKKDTETADEVKKLHDKTLASAQGLAAAFGQTLDIEKIETRGRPKGAVSTK